MVKKRRGLKGSLRRTAHACVSFMDPLWWLLLSVAVVIIVSVLWGPTGFFISLVSTLLLCALVWLFGDDDSAHANEDAMKLGQCWTNIAEISHKNAMHDDH